MGERVTSSIYQSKYQPVGHQQAFDPKHLRQRFKPWHEIKEPGKRYVTSEILLHQDGHGRVESAPPTDCYLSPSSGKLRELVVQATGRIFTTGPPTTWARTPSRKAVPWSARLSDMPYDPQKSGGERIFGYMGACLGLLFVLFVPINDPEVRYGGNYAPFPYTYRGFPKSAKNVFEDQDKEAPLQIDRVRADNEQFTNARNALNKRIGRSMEPKRLCIRKPPGERFPDQPEFKLWDVAAWKEANPAEPIPPYLFVSFTNEQFNETESSSALDYLQFMAEYAALDAKVDAFWCSSSCIAKQEDIRGSERYPDQEDVHRINDYIRGAVGVAIVLAEVQNLKGEAAIEDSPLSLNQRLKVWGRRAWTFNEILLARNKNIHIYTAGIHAIPGLPKEEQKAPDIRNKGTFYQEWEDAPLARQLTDHFEGTLILNRLELMTVAYQCLRNRRVRSWDKAFNLPGDRAYALAGLLQERPQVDITDSSFQAFARLSLANNNDRLLERLICVLPRGPAWEFQPQQYGSMEDMREYGEPWSALDDVWNANLWDIEPRCQISGVGKGDTVIIDGARAASIRWKGFKSVATVKGFSWKRALAKFALLFTPYAIFSGIILLIAGAAVGNGSSSWMTDSVGSIRTPLMTVGAVFLVFGLLPWLLSPWLVHRILTGKSYGQQAWLFGVEGYMNLQTIEQHIWGTWKNRLNWSPHGSSLSSHRAAKFGSADICLGLDAMEDEKLVAKIKKAETNGQKFFTLVDTGTNTVYQFLAQRPPVALLICGQEGGMQRAVGVSYDWTEKVLYREAVLRMPTTVLSRMGRIPRCQIGFARPQNGTWATID
ncbi:hypothetical protein EV356DRAFT_442991 [Viridothelium virens]|uniref:Heterokaryon incompatibility domain-containing protein n=1 Tax=Viridothelium virens TaxID=1048519 RepID=A0A6A6HEX9_VIRVR|nr:hypothetical protein EV356DRAFT_442991 [Viridothelium virens]